MSMPLPSTIPPLQKNEPPATSKPAPSKILPFRKRLLQSEAIFMQRYPFMWEGNFTLKKAKTAVQLHFVSGNKNIAKASLPHISKALPLRITNRMKFQEAVLGDVIKKIQVQKDYCILVAVPCAKGLSKLREEALNMKLNFIDYLLNKDSAGILLSSASDTQKTKYVISVFPPCDFVNSNVKKHAPFLFHLVRIISHFVVIVHAA